MLSECLSRAIRALEEVERYEEVQAIPSAFRLHMNENLLIPDEYYREIIRYLAESLTDGDIRFYPRSYCEDVRERIAELHKVDKSMILMTSGADEGLRVVLEIAARGGCRRVLTFEPTYGFASTLAKSLGLSVTRCPLVEEEDNFKLPTKLQDVSRTDLVYICNPNNPTGTLFPKDDVMRVVEMARGLVVIDETYSDFARVSHVDLVKTYENVALVRSMSKSWGLAGLRVGYVVARPEVIRSLERLVLPYSISSLSISALRRALELRRYVDESIELTARLREYLIERLREVADRVYRSSTNFVMFKVKNARRVHDEMMRRGFLLRYLGDSKLCRGCLRMTIARREVLDRAVEELRSIRMSLA